METVFLRFLFLSGFQFKSYYVVWKLIVKSLNRFDEEYGLNRTM